MSITIRHQAETVGAEVHLRHAGSPTNRQAQESRPALTPAWNVWDAHVRLSQKISVWEHTWPVYLTIRFNMTKYPYVKIRDDRRLNTIPLLYLLGLTMFIFNVIYMYVLNFTLFGTCIWLLTSYVITSTTIKLYRYSAAPNEVNVGMIWYQM